jgi:hypothetical protein
MTDRKTHPLIFSCEHATELQDAHQSLALPDYRTVTTEPIRSEEGKHSEDIGWYTYPMGGRTPGAPGCRERSPFSVDDAGVKGGGPAPTLVLMLGRGCGGGADTLLMLAGCPWRSIAFGGSVLGGMWGVSDERICCWDGDRCGWD